MVALLFAIHLVVYHVEYLLEACVYVYVCVYSLSVVKNEMHNFCLF